MRRTLLFTALAVAVLASGRLAEPVAAQGATLVIDGMSAPLRSADGGAATARVVPEPNTGTFPKKHVGGVTFEPLVLQFWLGAKPLYDWVQTTLQGTANPRNGSILVGDPYSSTSLSQTDFINALMTEVTFPAMDASQSGAVFLKAQIVPEQTRRPAKPSGSVKVEPVSRSSQMASNLFRFEIDGLSGNRISRIESFTIRRPVAQDAVGETRLSSLQPTGALEVSNLVLTMPEADAKDWIAWFDDFVIRGNNGDGNEKNFALHYLNPALTPVVTVNGFNAGIVAVRSLPVPPGESIRRVQVELYVERVELVVPPRTG